MFQKNIRLNSANYLVRKIPNKQELRQIVFNHSSDIDFKAFINLYKKYHASTTRPYSFFFVDATLASENINIS